MDTTSAKQVLPHSVGVPGTKKSVQSSVRRPTKLKKNWVPYKSPLTSKEVVSFSSLSRPLLHQIQFRSAMLKINAKAGGEPRRVRRSMARVLSKRKD